MDRKEFQADEQNISKYCIFNEYQSWDLGLYEILQSSQGVYDYIEKNVFNRTDILFQINFSGMRSFLGLWYCTCSSMLNFS
jgi:hypothetical protein